MTTTRRTLLAGSAAAATGAVLAEPAALAYHRPEPTVVLVHGAFADASGWYEVAAELQRNGSWLDAPGRGSPRSPRRT